MSRPNDVGVGVGVVLLNKQNRVLMLQRKGAHGEGSWSIPGGWVDREDASLEEVCRREVLEEMGIKVGSLELLGASTENFPDFRSVTMYYWTRDFRGRARIVEPNKASALAWVHVDDPPQPLFLPLGQMWHQIAELVNDQTLASERQKALQIQLQNLTANGHPIEGLEEAIAAGVPMSVIRYWQDLRYPLGTYKSFEIALALYQFIVERKDDPGGDIRIEPDMG